MKKANYNSRQNLANPSRKMIVAVSAAALVVCVAALVAFGLANRNPEARIMEIFSVDGPFVYMTRGTPIVVAASAGVRLHDGYGVFTGEDSICHIRLDADSIVRMDSSSRISVNRASATTLSILVEGGQILIDVQNQYPGHDLEVQVGNATLGVRGTLFITGHAGPDDAHVIMLEGSVYVDGDEPVSAGYVMALQDDEPPGVSRLRVEELDFFAMQAILDYSERVLEAGAITQEELDWIARMMDMQDYIWIQGFQISTALTDLHFTTDTAFAGVDERRIFVINLTDEDVRQLAYMVNLRSLTLNNHNISDIAPLAGLTNLTTLHIDYNQINDLTPLAGLTNLTTLWFNGNQVSDLSPLAGLVNLRALWGWNNNISDISPLAGLANLERVNLNGNQISSIAPLAGLANLSYLWISANPFTDWSPVAHVENAHGRP